MPTMRTMTMMATTNARPIHRGDRTHSHDHVMWPVSFRAINRMVSRPENPMDTPLEVCLVSVLMACLSGSSGVVCGG